MKKTKEILDKIKELKKLEKKIKFTYIVDTK